MKILEITFYLAAGGGERLMVDLSNELAKTNEVVVLTLKNDKIEPDKRQFYKSELSPQIVYKNLGLEKGLTLKMLWQVYRAIKNENPDIVHLHVHGVPIYCILAIILMKKKVKFFQTIHSDIYNGYNNRFYRFLIKTFGYSGQMGFIALSEKNYKDLIKEYPKVKGTCIVNGRAPITPTSKFSEVKIEMQSYKKDNNSMLFIHVARCNPIKNQQLLIKSFNRLIVDGYNAELVIIGDLFDSELGISLKKQACDRVHFVGPRKNISDYMLNADVFCLSSSFEGMPITMLEASLAGVPIVSTPVCGAIDLVKDGMNGIKSKEYTEDSYYDALVYSLKHYEVLRNNSQQQKDRSPYTIKICAEKYIEFFKK